MCLGIPMRIVEIDGYTARCEARGVERAVNTFLMQDDTLAPGDMVMVHVGNAIQRITEADAATTWELFDQILAAEGGTPGTLPADT